VTRRTSFLPFGMRSRRARLALLAALALLVAGCAGPVHPTTGAAAPESNEPEPAIPAAPALANAEASRLLGLVPLVSGVAATPVPTGPAWLSGPVTGRPEVASLVDDTRFWQLNTDADTAIAWVRTHPPTGLTLTGSSRSGSGAGPGLTGVTFDDAPSSVWSQASLEIGVVSTGPGTSAMRADALVVWLDSQPLTDSAAGARMRLLVAGDCPPDENGMVGVQPTRTDLTDRMVPDATPAAGLVCRYDGQTDRLAAMRRLGAGGAGAVESALRQTILSHPDGAVQHCPMKDDSAVVIALAYPGQADVDIWFAINGCPYVANGLIVGQPVGLAAALQTLGRDLIPAGFGG
jgi:hypothetical protein